MSKIENLAVGSTTYDITPDSVSVKDIRDIAGTPSAFTAKEVSPFFTNQGMPTSAWHAGINVCGWSGDYNQWQLVGYANETDADNSLYFRNGSTSTNSWYPWRTILDSKNYSEYALPITSSYLGSGGGYLYACWSSVGLQVVAHPSYIALDANTSSVLIYSEGATNADTTRYRMGSITRDLYNITNGESHTYTHTFPNASGKLLVDNVKSVSVPGDGMFGAMFGLPVGAEYTIRVHGSGDGAGYDDVFKLFVGDGFSPTCQHTVYRVESHLSSWYQPGYISINHMREGEHGSEYGTLWIFVHLSEPSSTSDSSTITVSTSSDVFINTSLGTSSAPEDYLDGVRFGAFEQLPIVELTGVVPISLSDINRLFT